MVVADVTLPRPGPGRLRLARAALAARDWRPAIAFATLLVLWIAARQFGWVDPRFLPSPLEIGRRLVQELRDGTILWDLAETLRRNLAGFAIGAGTGLALGALLGLSRLAARIVGPTLIAQRQVALFAWVPLIGMWFGGGDAGKIAFISVAAFQPVVLGTWRGIGHVPAAWRELAAALRFSRWHYLRYVAVPAALPAIFTGLHGALIYAWLATVGAEFFLNIAPGSAGGSTRAASSSRPISCS